jgi:hypothetical protein
MSYRHTLQNVGKSSRMRRRFAYIVHHHRARSIVNQINDIVKAPDRRYIFPVKGVINDLFSFVETLCVNSSHSCSNALMRREC